ncbi:hypothetical protein KPH14_000978, partial [Odynerus spinipes]
MSKKIGYNIRLHLSDEQALQFATENDAQQLQAKIKKSYAGAAEDKKIDATNDFRFLRMDQSESVSDYIARARGLATKCASLGVAITPRDLAYYTARGINNQYKEIKEILKTLREKSLEEIYEILKEREKEILRREGHSKGPGAAYIARKQNTRNCYICGKQGHQAKTCWHRKSNGRQQPRQYNKAESQGGTTNTRRNNFVRRKPASNVVETTGNNNTKYMRLMSRRSLTESGELHQAGENCKLRYEVGKGTVGIKVRNGNTTVTITVEDVLFVPDNELRENLLSTTVLTSKGYTLVQGNNKIVISNKHGDTVITDEIHEKHLQFLAEPYTNKCVEYESYNVEKVKDDFEIWHKRLGHINNEYLIKICNENLADGIQVTYFDKEFVCDTCNLGKITKKPHKILTRVQSKRPLELIHYDLYGPMPNPSIGGSQYISKRGHLEIYADASWGNAEEGKSFSGGAIMLGDSLVMWRSNKQKCVGLSACTVELFACSEIVKDASWIINILIEIDLQIFCPKPTIMYCDNMAAIAWLQRARCSNKTRHVNLKFHFVSDQIEDGRLKVIHIDTKYMIADYLTKAVTRDKLL